MDVEDNVSDKVASEEAKAEADVMMEELGTGKTAAEEEAKATDKDKKKVEEEEAMKRNEVEAENTKKVAETEGEDTEKEVSVETYDNLTSEKEPMGKLMTQMLAEIKEKQGTRSNGKHGAHPGSRYG